MEGVSRVEKRAGYASLPSIVPYTVERGRKSEVVALYLLPEMEVFGTEGLLFSLLRYSRRGPNAVDLLLRRSEKTLACSNTANSIIGLTCVTNVDKLPLEDESGLWLEA